MRRALDATPDRKLQRELLESLATAYPSKVYVKKDCEANPEARRALAYLSEHGLVTLTAAPLMDDGSLLILDAKITAKGIDFIADDGGLSAILGVVTIRLDADTIRQLIESRIAASSLPAKEKKRLVDQLRTMRDHGLKHLVNKLLDVAIEKFPELYPQLQLFIDQMKS